MIGLGEKIAVALNQEQTQLSVVRVRTAEPKYLVFDESGMHPKYVVQFGDSEKLESVREHLHQLASYLPSTVPHPLALTDEGDGQAMFVQTGLPGFPWFNLQEHVRSKRHWIELLDKSTAALADFHRNVVRNPHWLQTLNIRKTFSKTAIAYKEVVGKVPQGFESFLQAQEQHLRELDTQECLFQHGDFCINNILVDGERIGIIDFEHFGKTQMPLHDEFSLVRSLVDFFPGLETNLKRQCWELAYSRSRYVEIVQSQHLLGLLLHYLMWWCIEAVNCPSRRMKVLEYTNAIEALCQNASTWDASLLWS